jgi:hypothetical protein
MSIDWTNPSDDTLEARRVGYQEGRKCCVCGSDTELYCDGCVGEAVAEARETEFTRGLEAAAEYLKNRCDGAGFLVDETRNLKDKK